MPFKLIRSTNSSLLMWSGGAFRHVVSVRERFGHTTQLSKSTKSSKFSQQILTEWYPGTQQCMLTKLCYRRYLCPKFIDRLLRQVPTVTVVSVSFPFPVVQMLRNILFGLDQRPIAKPYLHWCMTRHQLIVFAKHQSSNVSNR